MLRVREAERERWAEEAQTRDDGASCWLNAFAVLLKPGCTHCHCGSFSRVFMMIDPVVTLGNSGGEPQDCIPGGCPILHPSVHTLLTQSCSENESGLRRVAEGPRPTDPRVAGAPVSASADGVEQVPAPPSGRRGLAWPTGNPTHRMKDVDTGSKRVLPGDQAVFSGPA